MSEYIEDGLEGFQSELRSISEIRLKTGQSDSKEGSNTGIEKARGMMSGLDLSIKHNVNSVSNSEIAENISQGMMGTEKDDSDKQEEKKVETKPVKYKKKDEKLELRQKSK